MIRLIGLLGVLCTLAACTSFGPSQGSHSEVVALAQALRGMSAQVDPAEAARAAELSYRYAFQLAQSYEITDPPLIHNAKVNKGIKARGLCYHWAADMQRLLTDAGFDTIEVQRAIANGDSLILIEHSTAVITAMGAPMHTGIVIDPWRQGGALFWSPVLQDTRYPWKTREEVLRARGQIRYALHP